MTEKKRWGIIGASAIARDWVIPALQAEGQDLVAVLSSEAERGKAFARDCGIERASTDIGDIVNDDDIDCVYISTTNELHKPHAIAAANGGKHVLCEKPLALELADVDAMIAAADTAGVVFATNHHMRGSGLHRKLKELIGSGAIGKVNSVRLFHAGYLPEHLQTWRLTHPEKGGGVALDLGVHDADTLRNILGEEPVEVTGLSAGRGMAQAGLDDTAMFVLRMQSGILAIVHESFVEKHAGPSRIEVMGTEGSLVATGAMAQAPGGALTLRRGDAVELIDTDRNSLYAYTIAMFVAAIENGGAPLVSGRDGRRSLEIALAAEAACRGETRVSIPPL
ncbi:Gfo/Idh/MocA family protein [Nitratireductor sp. ZSWI3]|uniref:Gfo/Idh/MocA family protein n=1 Tax=Nitratireductor sp. ZSWI3 TaxID=2966359 RepID=UPI00214FDCA9|nr:Gfo/Idh/MocA family oxidoreductase [Nitratireductor sp. ZSWI3]MCR4265824.1 Gfo/Idh/MocA family oxidoreductase [Nitratireductor sp. ZSWI3]